MMSVRIVRAERVGWLLVALMALPIAAYCGALPSEGQDGKGNAAAKVGGKPDAEKKGGSKGVRSKKGNAKAAAFAEKKARRILTDAFPKSKGLLAWMKTADPETHEKLLELSRAIVEEHEDEALAFAQTHHPELLELMSQLRQRKPKAYREAVANLAASSLKLRQTQVRDPEAYDSELQAWVLRSKARLVAARRLVEPPDQAPPSGDELRMLIEAEQQDRLSIERQIKNHERKIEKLRARFAEDPRASAERRLGQLVRKMRKK